MRDTVFPDLRQDRNPAIFPSSERSSMPATTSPFSMLLLDRRLPPFFKHFQTACPVEMCQRLLISTGQHNRIRHMLLHCFAEQFPKAGPLQDCVGVQIRSHPLSNSDKSQSEFWVFGDVEILKLLQEAFSLERTAFLGHLQRFPLGRTVGLRPDQPSRAKQIRSRKANSCDSPSLDCLTFPNTTHATGTLRKLGRSVAKPYRLATH